MSTMPKLAPTTQPMTFQKTDPSKVPLKMRKALDGTPGAATDSTQYLTHGINPASMQNQNRAGELVHTAMCLVDNDRFTPFFAKVMLKLAMANAPVAGQVAVPRTGTRQAIGGDIRTTGQSAGTRLPDGSNAIGEQEPIIPTPSVSKFFGNRQGRQEMLGLRAPAPPMPVQTKQAVLDFLRGSSDKRNALSKLFRALS